MKVTHDLAVCTDCVQIIANGEISDGTDTGDQVAAAQVVKWGDLAAHMVLGDTDEPWFSWSSCDGCGSPLGGDRFNAHILG